MYNGRLSMKHIILILLVILTSCSQKTTESAKKTKEEVVDISEEKSLILAELEIYPSSINFGNLIKDSLAVSTSLKIKNISSNRGKILLSPSSLPYFTLLGSGTCGFTPKVLLPGQECSVNVSLNPITSGLLEQSLTLVDSDNANTLITTIPLIANVSNADVSVPPSSSCKAGFHLEGRKCVSNIKIFTIAPDNTLISQTANYKCFWSNTERVYKDCVVNTCNPSYFLNSLLRLTKSIVISDFSNS